MTFNEENGLIQKIALLNHEIAIYLNGALPHPDINANNYFYLLKLLENPGITQSDFLQLVKLNQSSVTRAINALTKKGYITKVPAKDKRSQFLHLTQKGEQAALEVKIIVDRLNQQLMLTEPDTEKAVIGLREQMKELFEDK